MAKASATNNCVVVGTIEVLRGVYLMGLRHVVQGFSDGQGQLSYRALLNGQDVGGGSQQTWGAATLVRYANVSAIGRQQCNTQQSTRVPFRIEASLTGSGDRMIDSFDWTYESVGHCE